jgi:hypothetical protein
MQSQLHCCPYCGTYDTALREGPHLFLCVFCQALFSVFEGVQAGVDGLFVTCYDPVAPFFCGMDDPEHPDFKEVKLPAMAKRTYTP